MKIIEIVITGEPGKETLKVETKGLSRLESLGALQTAAQVLLRASDQKAPTPAPAPDAGDKS